MRCFLLKDLFWSFAILLVLTASCSEKKEREGAAQEQEKHSTPIRVPDFVADSAYAFIEKQVSFGPRVPNTEGHQQCARYLQKKFRDYGLKVEVQHGKVRAYNGKKLNIQNIMARYKPDHPKRIALFAHWDTRPMADRGEKRKKEAIPGANDGGSGVGVLLEIARQLNKNPLPHGVDIVLFDAEDQGVPEGKGTNNSADTWCLGSQYWAKHPPLSNYAPQYGILLDMVGSGDAIFPREGASIQYAPNVVDKIWNTAEELGYGEFFTDRRVQALTDDHIYVNRIAKIPTANIIHYNPDTRDFGPFHHTHRDNMDIISKKTLKAVGNTVLHVIYRE